MMRRTGAALWLLLATAGHARAQTAAQVEVAMTGGGSTQSVGAAATQARIFGEPARNIRYFLEAAWGTQSGQASDAFGGAYPYDDEAHAIEIYGEFVRSSPSLLVGVRGGRYRTPFGLYTRGDHAYNGFTRPPLVRYDDYFGLSNNFLDGGINVVGGTPALHAEVSLGVPEDVGFARRSGGFAPVVRVEGFVRGLILGASHMRSRPYDRRAFVEGDLVFTGVDLRYMHKGYQLRGEWITGRPFDGARTTAWYLDGSVHRNALGPVTLLARIEKLDYDAGRFSRYDRRYTGGARIQLPHGLIGQLAVMHQPQGFFGDTQTTAFDAALTWVLRVPGTP